MKKAIIVILLGVSLCFIPVLGYGEVNQKLVKNKTVRDIDFLLLRSAVTYMMYNPNDFFAVELFYDPDGGFRKVYNLPEDVNTRR
ncbi:MAG: hypothetical protein U9O41_08780 [Candidatus Aerophobetes bacterium]|nr:hypothetical protein [Candidatus Aerophobetes bacterium]